MDIAERSLADSPFQDPTTAVQALDRLHDILRQLGRRDFPEGIHRDNEGTVRLITRTMTWDAYVRLALDEIRLAGTGSPQITRRLMALLRDLRTVVSPDRVAVVDREINLLIETATPQFLDDGDAAMALEADAEGTGEPASLRSANASSKGT